MINIKGLVQSVTVFITILILGMLLQTARAEAPTLSKEEMYNQQLSHWVDKLAVKENCGKGIIDVNGEWSRGKLCFQKRTFDNYSKEFDVYDQKELAIAMIKDDYNNWKHWRCSTIKDTERCPKNTWESPIGLPPKK